MREREKLQVIRTGERRNRVYLRLSLLFLLAFFTNLLMTPAEAEDSKSYSKAIGELMHKNYRSAHKHFKELADQNDGRSQTIVGMLYEQGVGVEKSAEKAVDYYRRAAAQGIPQAESRLGHLMFKMSATAREDVGESVGWLEKAAQHGRIEAQVTLGKLYSEGKFGIPLDNTKARRWLSSAASQGSAEAQSLLSKIPGVTDMQQRSRQAGQAYGQGLSNLETSWKGYADIVNSVNQAAKFSGNR